MVYKCDPCDCPEQHYRDQQAWQKAMLTLLCDIEAAVGTITGQTIWNKLGTNVFLYTSTNNVGIGTATPGELLSLGETGVRAGVISFAGGTSGKIIIQAQANAGTYTLTLPDNDGNANDFLMTDGAGNLSWAPGGGGGGANTALSNLAAVAINTTIASDTDSTDDLGTSLIRWANSYVDTSYVDTINIGRLNSVSGIIHLFGSTSGDITIQSKVAAGTYTLTLPDTDGTPNQFLQTDGSGVLTWATALTAEADTLSTVTGRGATTATASTFSTSLSTPLINLGTAGATLGQLTISGSASGTITIQPKAAAGTYSLVLPDNDGNANDALTTDGSGNLSWAPAGGTNYWSRAGTTLSPATADDLVYGGDFVLPATTSTLGQIQQPAGTRMFHTYGVTNVFLGVSAGNFTLSGADYNTGIGSAALDALTSGDGNVGIGQNAGGATTTGSNNIAIGSGALATSSTVSNNIAIGSSALAVNTAAECIAIGSSALAANTSGTGHTAIGFEALKTISTSGNCTAMGYQALRLTTAYSGTAVGYLALAACSSGAQNTAIGDEALKTVTTNADNTAVGHFALRNATAANNTAVGSQAGGSVTSAGNNVLVGYKCASSLTQATNHVCVGYEAMNAKTTTGNECTALGYHAFFKLTSGSEAVAIGSNAAYNTDSGTKNTAIGTTALYTNTTGSNNVALGWGAAWFQADGVTSLTDPENSVYIGMQCRGYNNSDSNSIVIGYQAIGAGANTVVIGNSSIVDTYLKGVLHPAAAVTYFYRGINALRTLDATDYYVDCTANTFTVTLPTAVGIAGRTYIIKNSGTGVITIDGDGTETIDGQLTQTLSVQYSSMTIFSDGANWKVEY